MMLTNIYPNDDERRYVDDEFKYQDRMIQMRCAVGYLDSVKRVSNWVSILPWVADAASAWAPDVDLFPEDTDHRGGPAYGWEIIPPNWNSCHHRWEWKIYDGFTVLAHATAVTEHEARKFATKALEEEAL